MNKRKPCTDRKTLFILFFGSFVLTCLLMLMLSAGVFLYETNFFCGGSTYVQINKTVRVLPYDDGIGKEFS